MTSASREPCSPLPLTLRSIPSTLFALEATFQEPILLELNCTDYSCYCTESGKSKARLSGIDFLFLSSQTSLKGRTVYRVKWVSIFSCLPAFSLHPVSSELGGKTNAGQYFPPHPHTPLWMPQLMFRPHLFSLRLNHLGVHHLGYSVVSSILRAQILDTQVKAESHIL